MKTQWLCQVTLTPSRKKYTATYPTQTEALTAMAKVFAHTVNLSKYIRDLRQEDGEDCAGSADFLENFLATLTMPDEIPDHYDIPDHCLLEFDSCDGFRWGYMRGECPYLSVGHVCEGKEIEPYVIAFNYDNPKTVSPKRVNAIEIRIAEHINYGTSANPLLVWCALDNTPRTQDQLAKKIFYEWDTEIDRKAVGRHLQLLQNLGYPVRHCLEGYYCEGEPSAPKTDIKYSPSAYPLLILKALDTMPKTKTQIKQAIEETYGVKIDRKAVARNLELLTAFGYRIQTQDDGYYID